MGFLQEVSASTTDLCHSKGPAPADGLALNWALISPKSCCSVNYSTSLGAADGHGPFSPLLCYKGRKWSEGFRFWGQTIPQIKHFLIPAAKAAACSPVGPRRHGTSWPALPGGQPQAATTAGFPGFSRFKKIKSTISLLLLNRAVGPDALSLCFESRGFNVLSTRPGCTGTSPVHSHPLLGIWGTDFSSVLERVGNTEANFE